MRLSNLKTFILLAVVLLSKACVSHTPTEQTGVTPTDVTPIHETPTTEVLQEKHLIIHHDGTLTKFDDHTPEVIIIFEAVENLLATADSTYRLMITDDVIKEVRQGQALEAVFEDVQTSTIAFNQQPIVFIRLLIPLSGRYSDGTIFINGVYARELPTEEPEIEDLSDYWEVVINSEGTGRLMDLLEELPAWDQ